MAKPRSAQQSAFPVTDSLAGTGQPAQHAGRRRGRVRPHASQIAAIYVVCASLWIAFSDAALTLFIQDPYLLLRLSLYKGFAFVAVTALVLYLVIRRSFRVIEGGFARLRAQKKEIERFNRLYQAFSRINHESLTAANQEALFAAICQVLVEQGRFRMAWVGLLDPGVHTLEPEASAGEGVEAFIDYLMDKSEISAGSIGWDQVIRHGEPLISNDFSRSKGLSHWREVAEQHGLRSRAAFPLMKRGEVIGVLSVYASEEGYFQDNEISLLQEVVIDVSLVLDKFALAEERGQAEQLARREFAFSQAMIESNPGILYFYDHQGRFLRWNRNFEVVSGYSHDEVAGMHPLQFFAEEDQPRVEQRIAVALEEGEASVEADFLSRDGSRRPYFFTGRGLDFDGQRCLVGVGIDISERKRAETALRELNETLELRVAERTAQLEAAAERAEAADRLKSAFLATMSHELRTPLNSIIGFTGIILQELAGPLNEEQARQLKMVKGSARHLLELINDVLDLSKIEAGQLEVRVEPFDLRASVEQVIGLVEPLREKKDLGLSVQTEDPLPEMLGDRRRVEQILLNLLNNAIKFTDSGKVSLTVVRQEGYLPPQGTGPCEAVRICVSDSGIGIREQDLSSLFQPFHQLDTGLTRRHDGTGLGLMICRRLADLMGGEIRVRSEWGVGSEFTVILPVVMRGGSSEQDSPDD